MRKGFIFCTILIALVLGIVTLTSKASGDGPQYRALMIGCNESKSCQKKVIMSLGRIDGVKTVRFLKQKEDDLHQVVVETEGETAVSLADAVKALRHLDHYEVVRWEEAGS